MLAKIHAAKSGLCLANWLEELLHNHSAGRDTTLYVWKANILSDLQMPSEERPRHFAVCLT